MIPGTRFSRGMPIFLLVVVALLFYLLTAHRQSDPTLHNHTVGALNDLAANEDALLRDLLEAQSGLLHNFDGVNERLLKISRAPALLESTMPQAREAGWVYFEQLIKDLQASIERHANEVHRFLSDVAVFRKSLLYLPECARELESELVDQQVDLRLDGLLLGARMYVHDSSKRWSDVIDRSLGEIGEYRAHLGPKGLEHFERLSAHAEHIREYRERVSRIMRELALRPLSTCSESLLSLYLEHHQENLKAAKDYRATLAIFTLALLFALCVSVIAMNATSRSLTVANERDQRVNQSLASLASGAHSTKSEEFYHNSVKSLANAFSTAIACISLIDEDGEERLETIALYLDGDRAENVVYEIASAPCEDVLRYGHCVVESGVQQKYPEDAMLADMGIEGYFGRALTRSDGTRIGLMAVLDRNPIQVEGWMHSLLEAFADRIAGELEIRAAQEQLVEEKTRAVVTLRSLGDAVITVDRDCRITSLNPVAEELLGVGESAVSGQAICEVFHVSSDGAELRAENPLVQALRTRETIRLNNAYLVPSGGRAVAIEATASTIVDSTDNVIGGICAIQDVTTERELQGQLSFQASHDMLTGVYNRRAFEQYLETVVAASGRDENECTLLYIDLDRFKVVNDNCGHAAGDLLLKDICELIKANIRDEDSLGRLGGDEFGLLVTSVDCAEAQELAKRLVRAIEDFRFVWESQVFRIGASIGLVSLTPDIRLATDFLAVADTACLLAKEAGRNRMHVHVPNDTEVDSRRNEMRWVSQLHHALENNALMLYQQPIVPARTMGQEIESEEMHLEILIRMRGLDEAVLSPGSFMSAAERFGLMPEIDRWVLENSISLMSSVGRETRLHDVGQVGINLSGQTLAEKNASGFIARLLEEYQVDPARVCFEVTETAVIANMANAIGMIEELRQLGCRFALDDFGSGLSSYAYLKSIYPDYLKIDREFIRDLAHDKVSRAIVGAVVSVALDLGIKTVAEGVEDSETAGVLRDLEVDYLQGYFFGMPSPADTTAVGSSLSLAGSPAS